MSGASYPISTLLEMSAIPDEAMPRFLAELPTILSETRKIREAHAAFNDLMEGSAEVSLGIPEWIDDDLNQHTSTVTIGNEEVASITLKRTV